MATQLDSRIQWLHRQIFESRYPNAFRISEKFGISHRQAQRDIEYLKTKMNAPMAYDAAKKGFFYTEPFSLPSYFSVANEGDYTEIMDQLKQKKEFPTAFFCPGDVFAIEFAKAVRNNGLRIPEDISIISVDDLLISRYISPPLTTMTFDKEALGSCAVELLYAILSEKPCEQSVLIPTILCERDSVLHINK